MDLREIIQYNPSSDRLEVNKEILYLFPELKRLYRSTMIENVNRDSIDKFHELKILWWVCHPASPGFKSGNNKDVVIKDAIKRFSPKGWRRNNLFDLALLAYEKEMRDANPIYSLLRAQIVGISSATKTLDKITDALSAYSDNTVIDITDQDNIDTVAKVQDLLEVLLKSGNTLNKRIVEFKKIEEEFGREEKRIKQIRGNRPYKPSMDPDNDVERM